MAEENKTLEERCAELEKLLKEVRQEAAYYQGNAEEAGRRHLRETDQLSRLITRHRRAEEALRESERRYRELSITDGLTSLYNSRHFFSQLKKEIERVKRHGRSLSLLVLDLDDFKHYNDEYGHLEGDKVLVKIGEVIRESLRQTDSGYRYGGEEFTVVLPETEGCDALHVAERIREGFEMEEFSAGLGESVHLTASIGVAQYSGGEDLSELIKRADRNMYVAKKQGKNRVFFS